MNKSKIKEISLGDLIVALTEAVRRHIRDEKLVYEIVANLLTGIVIARSRTNSAGILTEPARLASVY
jgi:hypothetical protein